jgi:AraC-like DNA-binding protein
MQAERRYLPRDYVDVIAVTGGMGHDVVRPAASPGVAYPRRLSAGDLILYRAGDDITLGGDGEEGLPIVFVSFPVAEWYELCSMVGFDVAWLAEDGPPPLARFDPQDSRVRDVFEDAIAAAAAGASSFDLLRFWVGIAPYLFPDRRAQLRPAVPKWLQSSLEAMEDETNLRGGVRRLLELSHVSTSHLSTTTRQIFGKTPTALVTQLRLGRASRLLAGTTDGIAEIAQRCGFASASSFSTVFRRTYLVSPREYRRRARGETPRRA